MLAGGRNSGFCAAPRKRRPGRHGKIQRPLAREGVGPFFARQPGTLRDHSDRFVAAARRRSVPRQETAPERVAFSGDWQLDLQRPLARTVMFLRRTNDHSKEELPGRRYLVDPHWVHRLVRVEVDLTLGKIWFYRFRRREPSPKR